MSTLKEYTRAKHDQIENAPLSKLIMNKAINKTQWDMLVTQKAVVYAAIESRILMPDWVLLADSVFKDAPKQQTILISTHRYIEHLAKLSNKLVAAHVYVHYMGEMFGGQVLKKRIPHNNTTHMDIDSKTEAVAWIRELIHDRHEELKDEANLAFDLMMDIHNEIFSLTTANG